MFRMGDRVRLKNDIEFKKGIENVVLAGSDVWPTQLTLVCISDEKDGYVDISAFGIRNARLSAERLRLETPDDLD